MGARAIPITREAFLTPPEFQHVPQTLHPTARVGGALLELVRRGEETLLETSYHQIPLRVMPSFSFDDEPAALLYLITLTAGLMDGDGHLIDLIARENTRAVVTNQSATRVHPALSSFATQHWNVQVEDGAYLVVLPGLTIPYRGSRYYQRGRVELAPQARVIWGDIWLAGRYERGELSEHYQFDRIVQDFEVRRAGRLVYRDRFRWDGPWSAEEAAWHVKGEFASASLFIGGPLPEALPPSPSLVHRAVFPLESGDTCIRWCGNPMHVTNDVVLCAMTVAGKWTGGPDARPWLLNSSDLSPNHWFYPNPVVE